MSFPIHIPISYKIGIIFIGSILLIAGASALNTIMDGWRVNNGSTTTIDAHGMCARVTSASQDIFVPTKSSVEWSNFRSNAPGVSACAVPVNGACGTTFTCSAGILDPDSKEEEPKESYPRGCNYSWICKGTNGGIDKGCLKTVGCFAPDELVRTPYGDTKISDIKVGYTVLSYDESKNKFVENIVDRVIVHDGIQNPIHDFSQFPLLDVVISTLGVEKKTKVTANHLYFSPDDREYKNIGDFSIGDAIQSIDGIGYIVSKTELELRPTVYNLHMKKSPNNYLVNGVVVHNEKAEACSECSGASCGGSSCIPNGSCTATAPACGTTTYGVDNCDNACSRTGTACVRWYCQYKTLGSGDVVRTGLPTNTIGASGCATCFWMEANAAAEAGYPACVSASVSCRASDGHMIPSGNFFLDRDLYSCDDGIASPEAADCSNRITPTSIGYTDHSSGTHRMQWCEI